MKKRRRVMTYSLLDEITASPANPMQESKRAHQLTRMWQGLRAIETAKNPEKQDWQVCADAVNLMETLVLMGEITDYNGLIDDGVKALALAGKRSLNGANIRLDALGIQTVRAILEDYSFAIQNIPERTIIRCHRLTEKRMIEILNGKRKEHDIVI